MVKKPRSTGLSDSDDDDDEVRRTTRQTVDDRLLETEAGRRMIEAEHDWRMAKRAQKRSREE